MGDSLDTMDSDTMVVSDTTARGLLMLRLRLILTTPTDMLRTGIRWTPSRIRRTPRIRTPRIPRFLRLRKVNYIIIFQQPSAGTRTKMDCYQFELPFTSAAVQCYHTKSLVMVSRKQENQSGKNQTN